MNLFFPCANCSALPGEACADDGGCIDSDRVPADTKNLAYVQACVELAAVTLLERAGAWTDGIPGRAPALSSEATHRTAASNAVSLDSPGEGPQAGHTVSARASDRAARAALPPGLSLWQGALEKIEDEDAHAEDSRPETAA